MDLFYGRCWFLRFICRTWSIVVIGLNKKRKMWLLHKISHVTIEVLPLLFFIEVLLLNAIINFYWSIAVIGFLFLIFLLLWISFIVSYWFLGFICKTWIIAVIAQKVKKGNCGHCTKYLERIMGFLFLKKKKNVLLLLLT